MIGARGGAGIGDVGALMSLVDFILQANKEPEKIKALVAEIAQAKEDMLARLAERQAENRALKADAEAIQAANAAEQERQSRVEVLLAEERERVERLGDEVMAAKAKFEKAQAAAEKDLEARHAECVEREARVKTGEEQLQLTQRARAIEHKDKLAEVAQAKAAADAQRDALAQATARADAVRVDYETKLAKLKALAGS